MRQDYLGLCEECEAKEDGRPQCDVCGSYAHSFEDHDDAVLLARDDLQESLAQFRRGEILPVRPRPPWWQRALVRAALWLWRDR